MTPKLLITGPGDAPVRFLCAHGAGTGMDSPFLSTFTLLLADRGIATLRFEFAYMAARRDGGSRKPPPRAERMIEEYRAAVSAAIAAAPAGAPLVIGGKSMGGRIASMTAGELHASGKIRALVCLGYPFHPPKQPDKPRTGHLLDLTCPTLIVQGERDPFGNRADVDAMRLSPAITFHWANDGDHDLGPRGASGTTRAANLAAAADAVAGFATRIAGQARR